MSRGWETALEDSLLPRLEDEREGGERHRGGLFTSPKSFRLSQWTRSPSHPQVPANANCISQSRWGLRHRELGDWAHPGAFKEVAAQPAGRRVGDPDPPCSLANGVSQGIKRLWEGALPWL